jgi:hypothetical protein
VRTKWKEYTFTFNRSHLDELERIDRIASTLFIALICVRGRQICALPYSALTKMIEDRKAQYIDEDQYVVLVAMEEGKEFRAYMNFPGSKNAVVGKKITIPRNRFPDCLFQDE